MAQRPAVEELKDDVTKRSELPVEETERQTKLSSKEINNSKDVYIKPSKTISDIKNKFNERFRKDYEYDKEYVHVIAEHKEIIGEKAEFWTRKYGGMPAEYWEIPTNKPVWIPRYAADRLAECKYTRYVMQQNVVTSENAMGQMYGALAAHTVVNRLDAYPVRDKKVSFGASRF